MSGTPSKFEHAVSSFQRPGPEVLSRVIPVVFIGRNRDGFWVARDAEGKFGGLFWRKGAALRFAKENVGPAGCAAVFPQACFELDLDNSGNPLLGRLESAKHLLMRWALRLTAIVRKRAILETHMTLLTPDNGRSHYPVRKEWKGWTANHAQTPVGATRDSAMRRLFRLAITIMIGTAVLVGIIALKTEIYLSHFNQ